VSTGPQLIPSAERPDRNWIPLVAAAVVVIAITAAVVVALERGRGAVRVTPISAPLDPYATNLQLGNLQMSESTSLSGGKVTYLDGRIQNKGSNEVTGVAVQVLFRDYAHEVTQNETQSLKLIRTREPYIDVEPISAAPLKAGEGADFRLIFDSVSPNWDGAFPEIRILRVEKK
jgi:hypothetical protein